MTPVQISVKHVPEEVLKAFDQVAETAGHTRNAHVLALMTAEAEKANPYSYPAHRIGPDGYNETVDEFVALYRQLYGELEADRPITNAVCVASPVLDGLSDQTVFSCALKFSDSENIFCAVACASNYSKQGTAAWYRLQDFFGPNLLVFKGPPLSSQGHLRELTDQKEWVPIVKCVASIGVDLPVHGPVPFDLRETFTSLLSMLSGNHDMGFTHSGAKELFVGGDVYMVPFAVDLSHGYPDNVKMGGYRFEIYCYPKEVFERMDLRDGWRGMTRPFVYKIEGGCFKGGDALVAEVDDFLQGRSGGLYYRMRPFNPEMNVDLVKALVGFCEELLTDVFPVDRILYSPGTFGNEESDSAHMAVLGTMGYQRQSGGMAKTVVPATPLELARPNLVTPVLVGSPGLSRSVYMLHQLAAKQKDAGVLVGFLRCVKPETDGRLFSYAAVVQGMTPEWRQVFYTVEVATDYSGEGGRAHRDTEAFLRNNEITVREIPYMPAAANNVQGFLDALKREAAAM